MDLVPTGGVDQAVDALGAIVHRSDEVIDRPAIDQVEREIFDDEIVHGRFRRHRPPAGLVDIADENPCALARQQQCRGLADPGGTAGDDDGSILQIHRPAPLDTARGEIDVSRGRRQVSSRPGCGRSADSAPCLERVDDDPRQPIGGEIEPLRGRCRAVPEDIVAAPLLEAEMAEGLG